MAKTLLLTILFISVARLGLAQNANRFDVLITEIMADPTPVAGLPNAEYLEIKNVSASAYNVNGWRISDATTTATITSSFVLQPDSIVILCANSNVAALSLFGRTIGVTSFPSLDNDGDVITLRSAQTKLIHTVAYNSGWYGNEAKKEGGWSLEMIDIKNPCGAAENWKAAVNNLGGTPGKTNSVNGTVIDDKAPQLHRAFAIDSINIMLVFNEPLDSAMAAATANYNLPGINIIAAITVAPQLTSVQLKLATALHPGIVYTITATNISDCKGNVIGMFNKVKIGLPQVAELRDVVVNEILFNPRPNGNDYVEFYNRSNKIIDVSSLYVANRNSNGQVASLKKMAEEPFYIFPGEYMVVTEDADNLKMQYLVKNNAAILTINSLPSFPDDKGTVVLVSLAGNVIDEVTYDDDWHFGLLANDEGVALERLDAAATSQRKDNWHSAASTAGYGTPGYQNSQYKQTGSVDATLTVSPKIFSPDNDGRDDVATISYSVSEKGFVANIIIFNGTGTAVRQLIKNDLLALTGWWQWDGLGDNKKKLPAGQYIVFVEIFNLEGKRKIFKEVIVLARPLN